VPSCRRRPRLIAASGQAGPMRRSSDRPRARGYSVGNPLRQTRVELLHSPDEQAGGNRGSRLAGHNPSLAPSEKPPANRRGATSANHDQRPTWASTGTSDQTPEKNQCRQRPTGGRQPAGRTYPRQHEQQQGAQQKSGQAKTFAVAEPLDQGRRAESQQAGNLRRCHEKLTARPSRSAWSSRRDRLPAWCWPARCRWPTPRRSRRPAAVPAALRNR